MRKERKERRTTQEEGEERQARSRMEEKIELRFNR